MSKEAAQEHNQPNYRDDDEITLKELILKLQEFWRELWKNKFWIIAAAALIAAIFLFNAFITKPTYTAKLTFMINGDEGGKGGGIGSLLGQFGFGGGGGGGEYNMDRIVELAKSRRILQEAIFEKAKINGTTDYLANHIIDIYNFHADWEDSLLEDLSKFHFTHDNIAIFNTIENVALKKIHTRIIGSDKVAPILLPFYDKDTGILAFSIISLSEELSVSLLNGIYDKLSAYYISRSIEPQKNTYDNIKMKTDSLQNRLQSIRYSIAKFSDTRRGLLDNTSSTRLEGLRVDQTITATAYGEAIKNLELSDFTLRNETPVFQLIDSPIAPITPAIASKTKAIIIGGFIGGFLALLFFIGRKIIRDAINE